MKIVKTTLVLALASILTAAPSIDLYAQCANPGDLNAYCIGPIQIQACPDCISIDYHPLRPEQCVPTDEACSYGECHVDSVLVTKIVSLFAKVLNDDGSCRYCGQYIGGSINFSAGTCDKAYYSGWGACGLCF